MSVGRAEDEDEEIVGVDDDRAVTQSKTLPESMRCNRTTTGENCDFGGRGEDAGAAQHSRSHEASMEILMPITSPFLDSQ